MNRIWHTGSTRRRVLRLAGTAAGGTIAAVAGLVPSGRRAFAADLATGADIAKAKREGEVMLYTSLDTKIVDAVIKPFQEIYGITVRYYRGGSADVPSKILAEADAGRVEADVADASDVGAFLLMKERKLLRPYESPATKYVAANLRDPDGMWMADRLTQSAIQWNTKLVGDTPPQHWKDLLAPKYNGKLVYFSASNGDGAPRLFTLAQAFGWDLLEGYAASKPLRVTTPQVATQLIESGERVAIFCTNDNIAWRSKHEGKPTDFIFPSEGTPTELGAIGLTKDAPHPNAAMLFYDWWMGTAGQKILVDGGKYSSRSDLDPPSGSPSLRELKLLVPDPVQLRTQREAMISHLTRIFGGEWGG
jgi:iron(III) transport system substrate-binding protein